MTIPLTNATIEDVIKELTLEQKAKLLTGASSFSTEEVTELGIPKALLLDGGTGINFEQLANELLHREEFTSPNEIPASYDIGMLRTILKHYYEPNDSLTREQTALRDKIKQIISTYSNESPAPGCFPPGILLGATWNPSVVYEVGKALGNEALAYGVDVLLGTPNVNLLRDPLAGRLFEGYSEDPYLVSSLAPSLVKGVQQAGVAANVKHFAANNQETYRQTIDELIDERTLHELYLPAFQACVQEGGVKTVMSAYNQINHIPCSEHKELLTTLLRDTWGFDGLVVSDWGAITDRVASLQAGNDLEMPVSNQWHSLITAVQNGELSEEQINLSLKRFLSLLVTLPVFTKKREPLDIERSKAAAYQAAEEGIVLLRNKNHLLPLPTTARVAFVGDGCEEFITSGDGSARVVTNRNVSLLDAARELLGEANCERRTNILCDATVITIRVNGQEGRDRSSMCLDPVEASFLAKQIELAQAMNQKIILVLNTACPIDLSDFMPHLDAILCVFLPGMEGGRAAANILFGKANPSGKLPLTFPIHYEDTPTALSFPGEYETAPYREGIFVGYRYYDYKNISPCYPFGFGLSYSHFTIQNLRASQQTLALHSGEALQVSVDITNKGPMDGKEVLQLYIGNPVSHLKKPVRELKGFHKIFLQNGETKTVTFSLHESDFASYDPNYHKWIAQAGTYQIYVGNSSRNLPEVITITVTGVTEYQLGKDSTFLSIYENEEAYHIVLNECATMGIRASAFEEYYLYTPFFNLDRILSSVMEQQEGSAKLQKEVKQRIYKKLAKLDFDKPKR